MVGTWSQVCKVNHNEKFHRNSDQSVTTTNLPKLKETNYYKDLVTKY